MPKVQLGYRWIMKAGLTVQYKPREKDRAVLKWTFALNLEVKEKGTGQGRDETVHGPAALHFKKRNLCVELLCL